MRANLNFFKPEIPDATHLRVAVASLPTPFQKTLVLMNIEGLGCREISDAIEVPMGTASQSHLLYSSDMAAIT